MSTSSNTLKNSKYLKASNLKPLITTQPTVTEFDLKPLNLSVTLGFLEISNFRLNKMQNKSLGFKSKYLIDIQYKKKKIDGKVGFTKGTFTIDRLLDEAVLKIVRNIIDYISQKVDKIPNSKTLIQELLAHIETSAKANKNCEEAKDQLMELYRQLCEEKTQQNQANATQALQQQADGVQQISTIVNKNSKKNAKSDGGNKHDDLQSNSLSKQNSVDTHALQDKFNLDKHPLKPNEELKTEINAIDSQVGNLPSKRVGFNAPPHSRQSETQMKSALKNKYVSQTVTSISKSKKTQQINTGKQYAESEEVLMSETEENINASTHQSPPQFRSFLNEDIFEDKRVSRFQDDSQDEYQDPNQPTLAQKMREAKEHASYFDEYDTGYHSRTSTSAKPKKLNKIQRLAKIFSREIYGKQVDRLPLSEQDQMDCFLLKPSTQTKENMPYIYYLYDVGLYKWDENDRSLRVINKLPPWLPVNAPQNAQKSALEYSDSTLYGAQGGFYVNFPHFFHKEKLVLGFGIDLRTDDRIFPPSGKKGESDEWGYCLLHRHMIMANLVNGYILYDSVETFIMLASIASKTHIEDMTHRFNQNCKELTIDYIGPMTFRTEFLPNNMDLIESKDIRFKEGGNFAYIPNITDLIMSHVYTRGLGCKTYLIEVFFEKDLPSFIYVECHNTYLTAKTHACNVGEKFYISTIHYYEKGAKCTQPPLQAVEQNFINQILAKNQQNLAIQATSFNLYEFKSLKQEHLEVKHSLIQHFIWALRNTAIKKNANTDIIFKSLFDAYSNQIPTVFQDKYLTDPDAFRSEMYLHYNKSLLSSQSRHFTPHNDNTIVQIIESEKDKLSNLSNKYQDEIIQWDDLSSSIDKNSTKHKELVCMSISAEYFVKKCNSRMYAFYYTFTPLYRQFLHKFSYLLKDQYLHASGAEYMSLNAPVCDQLVKQDPTNPRALKKSERSRVQLPPRRRREFQNFRMNEVVDNSNQEDEIKRQQQIDNKYNEEQQLIRNQHSATPYHYFSFITTVEDSHQLRILYREVKDLLDERDCEIELHKEYGNPNYPPYLDRINLKLSTKSRFIFRNNVTEQILQYHGVNPKLLNKNETKAKAELTAQGRATARLVEKMSLKNLSTRAVENFSELPGFASQYNEVKQIYYKMLETGGISGQLFTKTCEIEFGKLLHNAIKSLPEGKVILTPSKIKFIQTQEDSEMSSLMKNAIAKTLLGHFLLSKDNQIDMKHLEMRASEIKERLGVLDAIVNSENFKDEIKGHGTCACFDYCSLRMEYYNSQYELGEVYVAMQKLKAGDNPSNVMGILMGLRMRAKNYKSVVDIATSIGLQQPMNTKYVYNEDQQKKIHMLARHHENLTRLNNNYMKENSQGNFSQRQEAEPQLSAMVFDNQDQISSNIFHDDDDQLSSQNDDQQHQSFVQRMQQNQNVADIPQLQELQNQSDDDAIQQQQQQDAIPLEDVVDDNKNPPIQADLSNPVVIQPPVPSKGNAAKQPKKKVDQAIQPQVKDANQSGEVGQGGELKPEDSDDTSSELANPKKGKQQNSKKRQHSEGNEIPLKETLDEKKKRLQKEKQKKEQLQKKNVMENPALTGKAPQAPAKTKNKGKNQTSTIVISRLSQQQPTSQKIIEKQSTDSQDNSGGKKLTSSQQSNPKDDNMGAGAGDNV